MHSLAHTLTHYLRLQHGVFVLRFFFAGTRHLLLLFFTLQGRPRPDGAVDLRREPSAFFNDLETRRRFELDFLATGMMMMRVLLVVGCLERTPENYIL